MANEKDYKMPLKDLKSGFIFRIYTENKNRRKIEKLTGEYFDGFSVIQAAGYWQGIKEKSLIIEVIGEKSDYGKIKELATNIRINNRQQSVLIQIEKNRRIFI